MFNPYKRREYQGLAFSRSQHFNINQNINVWDLTSSESSAMQFFHERTREALKALNSSVIAFFDDVVRQISFVNKSIKEQLITLSFIHQSCLSNDSQLKVQSRVHYGAALKSLAEEMHSTDVQVILSSCLLFSAIEMLQANHFEMFKHLKAGSNLVKTMPVHCSIRAITEPIFDHLNDKASKYAGDDIEAIKKTEWSAPVIAATFEECWDTWEQVSQSIETASRPELNEN